MPRQSRPDTISVWGPHREWWVYQPGPRLDLCLSEGVYDFVFHQKTYQFKSNMRISPSKHLQSLAQSYPWRAMLVDYHNELTLLYTAENGWAAPTGVFPMWSAHTETERLVRLLKNYPEPGEQVGVFTGADEPAAIVEGQEQRVMIYGMPPTEAAWEPLFRELMDVKRQFPHIIFHITGSKTIPRLLGTGVDSFDHPITISWDKWKHQQPTLLLANGSTLNYEKYEKSNDHTKWARLIGIQAREIFEQEDRIKKSRRMYLFNLRSLKWAFANYNTAWSMRVVDETEVDVDDPDSTWVPVDLRYRPRADLASDKWVCDLCSISNRCPFFRPGAICIVDDTEAAELAGKFKTRNAQDILGALGSILGAQTERANRALKAEIEHNADHPDDQKFSPEVTKMLAVAFDQGVTLARLVDPTIGVPVRGRGRTKVIEASVVGSASPQEFAADFAAQLKSMNIDISKLSEEDAAELLARIGAGSTLPAHVEEDTPPALNGGGSVVAGPAPGFRAAPGVNP